MTKETELAALELLQEAIELPSAERRAFVEHRTLDDSTLRRAALELLTCHENPVELAFCLEAKGVVPGTVELETNDWHVGATLLPDDFRQLCREKPVQTRARLSLVGRWIRKHLGTTMLTSLACVGLIAIGWQQDSHPRNLKEGRDRQAGVITHIQSELTQPAPRSDGIDGALLVALREAAGEIDTLAEGDLLTAATMHDTIGALFERLGSPVEAEFHFLNALDAYTASVGGEDRRTLSVRGNLARVSSE